MPGRGHFTRHGKVPRPGAAGTAKHRIEAALYQPAGSQRLMERADPMSMPDDMEEGQGRENEQSRPVE